MLTFQPTRHALRCLVLASGSLLAATACHAATAADAQARYQQDRAACMKGQTYEDRNTCLKEAGAAYDEAKRGLLTSASDSYKRNALKRCNELPQKDRPDCVARVEGDHTTVSGSVGAGGELRERVTTKTVIIPAPQ